MVNKTTSLYIDENTISVLVSRGERIKKWGKETLEPGLIQTIYITDTAIFIYHVNQLFKKNKIRTRKITLGISAQQCLTRQIVLPAMPKPLLNEAILREAKRLLPLAREDLYLWWQLLPAPENKIEVFLVAILRKNLDVLLQSLKKANLQVKFLFLKPMALARLIEDANCLIVDVQSTEFDIVLLDRGIPSPMRTVPFAATELTWEEKSPLILDEIDRIIKFYNTNNPQNPLPVNIPLFFSGEFGKNTGLGRIIQKKFGLEPLPLTAVTDQPVGFNPQDYLINIALNRQSTASIWNKTPVNVLDLNIVPEIYRLHTIKWTRVIPIPAGLVLAGVTIPLIMTIMGNADNIANARARLDYTNQVIQSKQKEFQAVNREIKTLEENLSLTDAGLRHDDSLLSGLEEAGVLINSDLDMVVDNFVDYQDKMALTRIELNRDNLIVTGEGADETVLLKYGRLLDDSGRFRITIVNEIKLITTGDEDNNNQNESYEFRYVLIR